MSIKERRRKKKRERNERKKEREKDKKGRERGRKGNLRSDGWNVTTHAAVPNLTRRRNSDPGTWSSFFFF